jgi:hypothetical protein
MVSGVTHREPPVKCVTVSAREYENPYRKTQKNNTKFMLLTKITLLYPFCYNNTSSITNQEYFRITIIAH